MDNILELEVTTTIQIDIPSLIDETGLTPESSTTDIADTVYDYITGSNDPEYYLLGFKEVDIIIKRVREYLNNR